jgi:hypothetical protein
VKREENDKSFITTIIDLEGKKTNRCMCLSRLDECWSVLQVEIQQSMLLLNVALILSEKVVVSSDQISQSASFSCLLHRFSERKY